MTDCTFFINSRLTRLWLCCCTLGRVQSMISMKNLPILKVVDALVVTLIVRKFAIGTNVEFLSNIGCQVIEIEPVYAGHRKRANPDSKRGKYRRTRESI